MIEVIFNTDDILLIVLTVVLLIGSGLLALAETSLVQMNRVKAQALVDDRRRGSKPLLRLTSHPEQFLNPILLMVLICQLISATLIGVLSDQWFGGIGVLIGTVFEVVVIFVLFEAVPKNWAVHNPERAALISAPIVAVIVAFPPVKLISSVLISLADLIMGRSKQDREKVHSVVTESELLAMADVAHAEEVIEPEERALIHSVIDFGDAVVREVMVPRLDMVTLESKTPVDAALEAALVAGFSRLPVHDHNVDDIVGIAYTKDLILAERDGQGSRPVGECMRVPHFVPESKHLSSLLREMQDEKYHLAVVVDEYGGTAGLVSLEDLIEELIGEIIDEFDTAKPPIEHGSDGSVVVSASTALDDAEELLGTQLPRGTWESVGGLFLDLAGRVPDQGDVVEGKGLRLVAEGVDGHRISRVRIGVLPENEIEEDTQ